MYKLFMALRYLRAHRIIYFSIAGVAVGIMVMIIVLSVMGGFSRTMKERIRGVQSDIVVRSVAHDLVFYNPDELAAEIRKLPHVTGCAPRLEYLVLMTTREGSREGVGRREIRESMRFPDFFLMGIDPDQEKGTGNLPEYFAKGKPGKLEDETFRAEEGELPVVAAGSEIFGGFSWSRIALQTVRKGDMTPLWLVKDFQVRGWFKSGMAEYDSKLFFAHIDEVRKFLRFGDQPYANVLAIGVENYSANAASLKPQILETIHKADPCSRPSSHADDRCGKYTVRTWEEERSTLLAAVEVEKGIQMIILFCIVIVAGFNIIAIYTLMVRAKTKDVGILKSLGGTPGGITSIFLLSGASCGLVGSVIGVGLGLLISLNLNGIVDFVRISSRELNRLAVLTGPDADAARNSSVLLWPMLLYAAALGALFISWVRLYRRWKWSKIIPAAAAGILFAAASFLFYKWVPEYRPVHEYDWPIAPSVRLWVAVIGGLTPILWFGVRRLTEGTYDTPWGHFYRLVGTVVYSALAVAIVGSFFVAFALLMTKPGWSFQGYDLFPRHIYYFDRLPIVIQPLSIAIVVGATLFVSVVFSLYPAIRAARTDPIEAIRDE